jgi:hypothetical protein
MEEEVNEETEQVVEQVEAEEVEEMEKENGKGRKRGHNFLSEWYNKLQYTSIILASSGLRILDIWNCSIAKTTGN